MSGILVSLCPESRFRSLRIGGFHYPGFRVYSGPVYSQFFGWFLGFGKKVKIMGQDPVIKEFQEYLDKIREMY